MRIACRVCKQSGRNPIEWLEEQSHESLALWEAFYRTEPWGDEYQRWALQAQLLDESVSMSAAKAGVKRKPHQMKDFMPAEWIGHKRTKRKIKGKTKGRMMIAHNRIAASFPTADKR